MFSLEIKQNVLHVLINSFLGCSSLYELASFALNYNTSSWHFGVRGEMSGDYDPFYTTSV